MTKHQKTSFIPSSAGINYSFQSHNHDIAEPIEIKENEGGSYFSKEPKNEISHTNDETSKELINTPLYTNNETSNANHDSNSDHLNKINEAVILHHEGIKAFLNKYTDVQVLRAFYFEATDRFLIFCKDLKVKKKEEYCLFWWDWMNRITTKSGDYIDCFLQYERLVDLMGNPKPISLPEAPDLTEYYRNVTYCPADGKRCEQFTLSLGV